MYLLLFYVFTMQKHMKTKTVWQKYDNVEYEAKLKKTNRTGESLNFTGWYRYANGRLEDGSWPHWNYRTKEKKFSL